ncbi:MAG: glycosyltransferase [Alphaproteobacteria bacterium]
MGSGSIEVAHVLSGYDALSDCDVVHDHTLLGPLLASRQRGGKAHQEVVTTAHGRLDGDDRALYAEVAAHVPVIAISRAQARSAPVRPVAVIHHAVDTAAQTLGRGDGQYVAFVGRMSADKGVDRAIAVARGRRPLAHRVAKMSEPGEREYFESRVRPHLGPGVDYLGELRAAEKFSLLADAQALLNPIAWPEPFGLVMIEALAVGTPVIASPLGAGPEIVRPGRNGWLCRDLSDFVSAVGAARTLSRRGA